MSLEKYSAIVRDQQAKIDRLVAQRGVGPVRRVFSMMLGQLEEHATDLPRTFTETTKAGMLAQTRAAMARFVARGSGELAAGSAATMAEAAGQGFQLLARMERELGNAVVPLPVNEIALLKGATARRSSLLATHQRSLARYGAHLVGEIEHQAAVGLTLGENTHQIIDRVQRAAGGEWWQAERIVRTEMSYAYNAGHRDAIDAEAAAFDGDVYAQWSEQANEDGSPLDDRVAVDSLAMHGQVAAAGELFTQPRTSRHPDADGRTQVPNALVDRQWSHPPNRPNDRATLTPWRPSWGVPGWFWRDGARVDAVRALAPPPSRRRGRAA